MVNLKSFTDDTDQVEHLIKWWISQSDNRYHRVRLRGTVRDFINDVWVKLLANFRDGKQADCTISTAISNQCRWELYDQNYGVGERTIWAFKYKMRTARRIKPSDLTLDDDHAGAYANEKARERAIAQVLRALPIREAAVIRARFGLFGDPELTLLDVAKVIKRTRERVRQLESVGLKRIQHHTLASILVPHLDDHHVHQIEKDRAERMQKTEYGQVLFEELMKED